MNLHEYQAKALLEKFGLPVPEGKVASTLEEALAVAEELLTRENRKFEDGIMVKAQVHAGGRGKAGGVRYITNKEQFSEVVKSLLGKRLVTHQTDEKGQPVNQVLIALPCDIEQELYLSMLIDRQTKHVTLVASAEGGVEIEEVSAANPEKILTIDINPLVGIVSDKIIHLGKQLNLPFSVIKEFVAVVNGVYTALIQSDLSMIEINPLIIDKQGHLVCLDAKITVDDNALYRQSELSECRDPSQEDPRESHARDWELNYIALDGKIGCMVNGAGLAMATMDLIKHYGSEPANFLDVGGGATKERVIEAFKIILSDENVKGVLINIFGGIVRCDMIAEGIIGAISEVGIKVPVMVRLVGNNADKGIELLRASGLNLMAAEDLTSAAKQIIEAVA
jgi:succinyl-CoA synthetase beta subunit